MMTLNPFIEVYQDPITTLGTLAYILILLSITVALAGLMWSTVLHLGNVWEFRHTAQKFGPQWRYVPPMSAFGRVAGLLFLAGVESALIGGIIYIIG